MKHGISVRERKTKELVEFIECDTHMMSMHEIHKLALKVWAWIEIDEEKGNDTTTVFET